ncbi:hypothetical protein [Sinorhizobium sp. Sb3]|uniref:hypothetical protein n=1 Tax=Sinorhizobium sp. Sb3 TaxID=1358417 RepID=UPI0012E3C03F|nr:hypothetical protein [Sinorhizobium sp. Sb3]
MQDRKQIFIVQGRHEANSQDRGLPNQGVNLELPLPTPTLFCRDDLFVLPLIPAIVAALDLPGACHQGVPAAYML